jgi:cobalt-zinc-cadmium efflux system protein
MANGPGHRHSGDHGKPLRAALLAIDGVVDIHDLHVWTITSRFRITHSTFQIESEAYGHCAFGSCDVKPPTSS